MNNQLTRDHLIQKLNESYLRPDLFDRESFTMDLFEFQYSENKLYREYCKLLNVDPSLVNEVSNIPLLPISAFKHHEIKSGDWVTEMVFKSSGTTSQTRSVHHVRDVNLYLKHVVYLWEKHFGPLQEFCFLALLPGYVERGESSLVCMVDYFMKQTQGNGSDYVLYKESSIASMVKSNLEKNIKSVIFGVSFALDQLVDRHHPFHDENLIIVETGGMKGIREDVTKEAMFDRLQNGYGTTNIYSEYGMTELFSQAYTDQGTSFVINPYLDIRIKQLQDPTEDESLGKQGVVGCIDLANIDTCAFILTEDSGVRTTNNRFQLTGRVLAADTRGCNLLLTDVGG